MAKASAGYPNTWISPTSSTKNSFILLIIIFQIYQIKIILKYLNFNFYKNNKFKIIKNLYYKPNHLILLIIIIFLILILFIITKICYIKNKNLRTKK